MKTALLAVPFLLAIALIVCVEGPFSGFEVWNALPVALGFGLLLAGRRFGRAAAVGCTVFAVLATLLEALFHLAWMFDWHRTATGSSTSALAFIFVPIWACILGGVAGALAWGISKIVFKKRVAE